MCAESTVKPQSVS